jgi:hypothetical protein
MSAPLRARRPADVLIPLSLAAAMWSAAACRSSTPSAVTMPAPAAQFPTEPPSPDPRIGLRAGLTDAGEAVWNLRVLSETRPSEKFAMAQNGINSDLAFTGSYVIQGNFNGYQVWDISNPRLPTLRIGNFCPASQSDVSVYKNLLFVSAEGATGRIDCGAQGVKDPVSDERIRGIRIFDVTDLAHPRNVANVQTCRGSHTHTVVVDPKDQENVYVYVSGSAPIRSANELPGCVSAMPDKDPASALFRIEVIKVPLSHPEQAAIVSSPRIFNDLTAPATHGGTAAEKAAVEAARARGEFVANVMGQDMVLPPTFTQPALDSVVRTRGGTGAATAADSATLRAAIPGIIARMMGMPPGGANGPRPGPTQCHDITVYPEVGLAGGACEGYGLLLDIHDVAHPVRIAAAADSNFSYWHSATFNNDGTKVLFSDEWGGGTQPKCRTTDPRQWGADAIFTISGGRMQFQSYYKMPAPQTAQENCVAHNGSLIPIPGRDVMVQAWYQGGISVFDWTDAAHPKEIAFFDRGPVDATRLVLAGSWSAYWYNGVIVSSEIARGLDILELTPSAFITQDEIDAAKTVHLEYLNVQGQPKLEWPASFPLARSYLDQLDRSYGLAPSRLIAVRQALAGAEKMSGMERHDALTRLASQLAVDAKTASDAPKARMLAGAVKDLADRTR